nr:tetratricopeptide repeat protein [Pseudomonas sp. ML96]
MVEVDDLPALLNSSAQTRARLVIAAARRGELEAQVMLGQLLLQGQGIERDTKLALTWFRLAAQRGSAMADNMLGRCLEHGWGGPSDLAEAARHYQRAAQSGLDWGLYNLANLVSTGRGLTCDPEAAFTLYQRAAALGHAKSMNLLGRCYEDGLGVTRDSAAALLWYRRSAEAGDFRGQFSLAGVLAALGQIAEAEHWLRLALEHGNLNFLRVAGRNLLQVDVVPLRALARPYHQRAAELGDASDQAALAALDA